MGRLLIGLWRAIGAIRHAIGNLLLLGIAALVVFAIFSRPETEIPDSAALVLNLSGNLVEQRARIDPLERLFASAQDRDAETLLKDVLDAIAEAESDERIKAIVLDLSGLRGASLSHLQDVGRALTAFRATGREILSYGASYSQNQFYLASRASSVYLSDLGIGAFSVFLQGYGIFPTYYRSALDKLDVTMHVFRVGTFKSAVEPFTRDDMSDEAREANRQLVTELWGMYRDDVIRERGIAADAFDRYTTEYDRLLADADNDAAQLALSHGLVDGIRSREAWIDEMAEKVGRDGQSFNRVNMQAYLRAVRPPGAASGNGDRIAVLVASGVIVNGTQPPGSIGGRSTAKLIRQARESERIRALVLRIDSPGGSANAAEMIRSELDLMQRDGKPVVVSMSGTAASGGYWIAAGADEILAAPSTITGSIGIFGMLPTFERTLAGVGVHSDGVGSTPIAGAMDPFRSLSPVVERSLQRSVEHGYRRFVSIVSEGRDMTVEAVDQIGQGRVWSGQAALAHRLIDRLGSLDDAIAAARERAELDDYELVFLEVEQSARDRILSELLSMVSGVLGPVLGDVEPLFDEAAPLAGTWAVANRLSRDLLDLSRMNDPGGLYLHCLYCSIR